MKTFAVIGDHRVHRSLSPRMHNRVLAGHGIAGCYTALAVEPSDLPTALAGLSALSFQGVNVTVPHKIAVAPLLDGLGPVASRLGAVNTIVFNGNGLYGHNTDVAGFLASLMASGLNPDGCRALVFGAGGAARAALMALETGKAAEVTLAGRNLEAVREAAALCGCEAVSLEEGVGLISSADLVVNATSVSAPEEGPELAGLLKAARVLAKCRLVADLNYGRKENIWQDLAQRLSCPFSDGLSMLAHQAALSFRLWTGVAAEAREFLASLESET